VSWENRYAGLSVGTWEVGRLEVTKCFEYTCETAWDATEDNCFFSFCYKNSFYLFILCNKPVSCLSSLGNLPFLLLPYVTLLRLLCEHTFYHTLKDHNLLPFLMYSFLYADSNTKFKY
jgi:hypothetical protein